MSYRIEFDSDHSLVTVTFGGAVSLADILEMRAKIAADPRFDPRMARLLDLRQGQFRVTPAEVALAAQARRSDPLGRRLAFLVSRSTDFGLSRMMQGMLGGDMGMHVFYDLDKALRWLQRDEAEPE